MNSKKITHCSGFTLVEVMVALLIVVMSVSALLFRIMSNTDSTAYLRDKSIAQWVAINQLTELRLRNQHTNQLPEREIDGSEQQLGREWFWRMTPKKTQAENFLQVEIQVFADREQSSPLVTVTGLLDSYHWE